MPFSPFFQFITMRKTHVLRKVIDKISIFAMMIIIVFSINEVLLMKDTSISYHTKIARQRTERLRTLIQTLPPCCQDFFRGIEPTTTVLTRLNYAYDLRLFFHYLIENEEPYYAMPFTQINDEVLATIRPIVLERYLEYLNYYKGQDGREYENTNTGKKRKIATLKSFFKYLYKMERIPANIAEKIDMPKIKEKPIIRLEPDEVAKMMDEVEKGTDLTKRQQKYHEITRLRDVAIFTLLLGTGIRISELVGLDIEHFDFSADSFVVTRKGGARVILYFGEEVEKAVKDYLAVRETIIPVQGSEHALFLSMQKKRMSQRAIQMLVKEYAKIVTPLKKISPHKFRSTYGTMLNYETGDIYLVADVLGNKDVNTTRKHYAAMSDEKRRMAAGKVKLRE